MHKEKQKKELNTFIFWITKYKQLSLQSFNIWQTKKVTSQNDQT